jgi:DNA-binding response OmpR family regulator
MNYEAGNQPVILLVDESAQNSEFIKRWLCKNEFMTCEAADIFQALEQVSDFTVRQCPDVILLEDNSLPADLIKEVFQASFGVQSVSIIALSNQQNDLSGSLAHLKQRLDKALPRMSHAA